MKFSLKLNALAIGFALACVMISSHYVEAVRVDVENACPTGARYDKNGDITCPQLAVK